MNIKHSYQPTGNSCGPTCLYMVAEFNEKLKYDLPFDFKMEIIIEDISDMCGTDWFVGTPPDRMEKGMKALNLEYIEYLGSTKPYDLIREVIKSGNVPILRTITKGVPHWIIVRTFEFDNIDMFYILDPWLGEIKYSEKELDEIWKVRQYQFFEVIISECLYPKARIRKRLK